MGFLFQYRSEKINYISAWAVMPQDSEFHIEKWAEICKLWSEKTNEGDLIL